MFETADWTHRGEYIAKHGTNPDVANEALADPNRVVINPESRVEVWAQRARDWLLDHRADGLDRHCD